MWLDFWKFKGYFVEFLVNLVFVNDLMFFWINLGVVILKKYFDGLVILENLCIINV